MKKKITLLLSERQYKKLEELKSLCEMLVMTKAILSACEAYASHVKEIEELRSENRKLKHKNSEIIQHINNFAASFNWLANNAR